MYKPHTIEHYKLLQILNDQFALEQFDISPLSRSSLLVEDRDGGKIAFSYDGGIMRQAEIPSYLPLPRQEITSGNRISKGSCHRCLASAI